MKSEIRFCNDIGMFCYDRPVSTCRHCTSFCKLNCYNRKLYDMYHAMSTKDVRNEAYWAETTGAELNKTLSKKRKQTARVRFMTRGEAISTAADVDKIVEICTTNSSRLFWLPTRAWRNTELRALIIEKLFPIKNLRLLASIDPSNTAAEIDGLITQGFSTMFFGNDDVAPIANSVKCQKTWEHKTAACATCENGCFKAEQKHIWLKQH